MPSRSNGLTAEMQALRTLSHYEAVPPAVQQALIGQHKVREEE